MIEFTIIIPFYNVEKYIDRCLKSVMAQSYQNYEVILVDDGSTDDSIIVAKKYQKEYCEKIKLIEQNNKGQGGARNTGIKNAQGEYLVFVDSDDWIDKDLLLRVHNIVQNNKYQIITYNAYLAYNHHNEFFDMNLSIKGEQDIRLNKNILRISLAVWNKVFRRDFWEKVNVQFPEKTIYEDTSITVIMLMNSEKIFFLDEPLYYYYQRKNSTMHAKYSVKKKDIISVNSDLKKYAIEKKMFDKYRDEIEWIATNTIYLMIVHEIIFYKYDKKNLSEYSMFMRREYPMCKYNKYLSDIDRKRVEFLYEEKYDEYDKLFCKKNRIKSFVADLIPISVYYWIRKRKNKR